MIGPVPHSAARILVVDDEPANVELIDQILKQVGYEDVCTTTDSSQVLSMVDGYLPDLILLDLHMPPPDGFELLEQLHTRRAHDLCPVVVLTADASPAVKRRALRAGASDFLIKPLD